MRSKNLVEPRFSICGLLLLLALGCSSTPSEPMAEVEEPPAASSAGSTSNRRIFEGCDAEKQARRYERMVGEDVLVTFAWKDSKKASANLEVPAKVLRIDAPYVTVDFDQRVPNLELYTSVWTYSGHIHGQADGAFGVDPCSATIERGGW